MGFGALFQSNISVASFARGWDGSRDLFAGKYAELSWPLARMQAQICPRLGMSSLVLMVGFTQPGPGEYQLGAKRLVVNGGARYVEELEGLDDRNHIL